MSSPRRYKLARAGNELGVFDTAALVEGLESGHFVWTDDCWGEGDTKWGKLSDIAHDLQVQKANVAVPPRSASSTQPAAPVAVSAPTRLAPSTPALGWLAYAGFGCLLAVLLTMLFGLFRQENGSISRRSSISQTVSTSTFCRPRHVGSILMFPSRRVPPSILL